MIGKTLSHYKILEELSRGGMGIVYRAFDTKLNREVAFKVLPAELINDPERKRRFMQEAQAAASLEHPHIATIYEVDHDLRGRRSRRCHLPGHGAHRRRQAQGHPRA
jgi:serine/threonine-protein kinase